MEYLRYITCRNGNKSMRDRFRVIRANSSMRLPHKFRREGHHSWFLRCSKDTTWYKKWPYQLNFDIFSHRLRRIFVLCTNLITQKQAQVNIRNNHINYYYWRLNSETKRNGSLTTISIKNWKMVNRTHASPQKLIYLWTSRIQRARHILEAPRLRWASEDAWNSR